MDSQLNHFDQNARHWDQRPTSQQLVALPDKLLAQVSFNANDHVLDFGAGTGLLAVALASRVAQVTALDTSANMLQVLTEKGVTNIRTLKQDIFDGLAERYDAVVSCMAMHHVEDTTRLLSSFHDALNPGGRIALVDLYAEDGSFHGDNAAKGVKHFGFVVEHLRGLVTQAGFSNVHFSEILHIHRSNGRAYPLFLLTADK